MRRKSSTDRLGLTLYYRDTHNGTSDVIVGEVSRPICMHEYSYNAYYSYYSTRSTPPPGHTLVDRNPHFAVIGQNPARNFYRASAHQMRDIDVGTLSVRHVSVPY